MSETFKPAPGDVELVQREECFRGFYRLDRLRLRHRQFDGSMGREISRELFVRHDAELLDEHHAIALRVVGQHAD
ncbi:ADP-ribose diphosphatase, partial [Pseudomonas aeruginosa]